MSGQKILFVDRDGTLIEEPADFQIDAFEKLRFVRGVIPALLKLRDAGFQFVIVSNQDGLGSEGYPRAAFDGPNDLMLQVFESQGIRFREVLVDCSWPADNAPTRKPALGLVQHYLRDRAIDLDNSAMVGDRETDLQFAQNLGIRGFQLRTGQFGGEWDWAGDKSPWHPEDIEAIATSMYAHSSSASTPKESRSVVPRLKARSPVFRSLAMLSSTPMELVNSMRLL
jgi:imidazoleglycerol-phosphate dehydratase / histidinol-phosphatase